MTNLDQKARELIAEKPNLIVPWFLMASYLYYHKSVSLLSDNYYDELSKELLSKWDSIEHFHKHLITKEDLEAGTLYRLKEEDYPVRINLSAFYVLKELDK